MEDDGKEKRKKKLEREKREKEKRQKEGVVNYPQPPAHRPRPKW